MKTGVVAVDLTDAAEMCEKKTFSLSLISLYLSLISLCLSYLSVRPSSPLSPYQASSFGVVGQALTHQMPSVSQRLQNEYQIINCNENLIRTVFIVFDHIHKGLGEECITCKA